MLTLAHAVARRGHRVSFVGKPDGVVRADARGVESHAIGAEAFPEGSMATVVSRLGELHGRPAIVYTLDLFHSAAKIILDELGEIVEREKIDGLVVDQVSASAGTVADALGIPHVSVANALAINDDPAIPPVIFPWRYRESALARLRNRIAHKAVNRLTKSISRTVNEFRRSAGLDPIVHAEGRYSQLAQIAQQPSFFDFPRARAIPTFHYTGPFHERGRDATIEFPWDRLDGRPLIYASMGTLQNRLTHVFQIIAEACAPLEAQLVLSLGGGEAEIPPSFPGDPIVVPLAPQLALLERADLVVTHAGLNTALECLAHGVPTVAIPVTNDQPGVAARMRWLGAGLVVPLRKIDAVSLRAAIERVLTESSFQERAEAASDAIGAADGIERAGVVVEQALTTASPVVASG